MRDSGIAYYNSVNKCHLIRLPNLSEPSPKVENTSKRLLVLFPLFSARRGVDYVKESGAIGAVWARDSWLRNTDAIEYGIEMKFYVEDKVSDRAIPILQSNFVDMEDVLLFNAEGFGDTHFSKKIVAFTDLRFREYDWILVMDIDIFAVSETGAKVPFFHAFFEGCIEGQIGNCCSLVRENGVPINWTSYFSPPETPFDEAQARWRAVAETLVDKALIANFWDEEVTSMITGGGMHVYPAKTLMQNSDNLEWFIRVAQTIGDDEPVIALWHARGNPVWNVKERVNFNEVFIGPEISDNYQTFKKFI